MASSGGSILGVPRSSRTIEVGAGVGFVSFGEGAVWAANYVDGVVSRIDPRTNEVTARTSVGAPQAIAAGAARRGSASRRRRPRGLAAVSGMRAGARRARRPRRADRVGPPLQGPNSAGTRGRWPRRSGSRSSGAASGPASSPWATSPATSPTQSGGFDLRSVPPTPRLSRTRASSSP